MADEFRTNSGWHLPNCCAGQNSTLATGLSKS